MLLAIAQEIPDTQLEWKSGDEEFFPLAFQGTWGPSLAGCSGVGEDVFTITRTKLWFYEGDAKLIKISNVSYGNGPGGAPAYTLNAYAGYRELMDLSTGTVRLTLFDGKLYMTRPDAVPEDQQWQYPSVRCPKRNTK